MQAVHPAWLRAVAVMALLAAGSAVHALESGNAAPALALAGSKGGSVAVPATGARLTYLDFWASWCSPCRQSFPWMNEMQAKYGAKGLRIVAVNLDAKAADAERFLQDMPARFEVALDPKADSARRYAVKGMPSSVLIDGEGRIVAVHQGFRADDGAVLEKLINTHLNKP